MWFNVNYISIFFLHLAILTAIALPFTICPIRQPRIVFFLLEQCLGMHSTINCGDKTNASLCPHPSCCDNSLWQDSSWEACPCVNPTFVHLATNWLLGSSNDGGKSWRNQLGWLKPLELDELSRGWIILQLFCNVKWAGFEHKERCRGLLWNMSYFLPFWVECKTPEERGSWRSRVTVDMEIGYQMCLPNSTMRHRSGWCFKRSFSLLFHLTHVLFFVCWFQPPSTIPAPTIPGQCAAHAYLPGRRAHLDGSKTTMTTITRTMTGTYDLNNICSPGFRLFEWRLNPYQGLVWANSHSLSIWGEIGSRWHGKLCFFVSHVDLTKAIGQS